MWDLISKELFIYGYYIVVDTKRAFVHRKNDGHIISILDIENKQHSIKSFMRDFRISIILEKNK
jgi:hypothetical protein